MPRPPARTRPHTAGELRVRPVNVYAVPVERSPSAVGLTSQSASSVYGRRPKGGDGTVVADSPGEHGTDEDLVCDLWELNNAVVL